MSIDLDLDSLTAPQLADLIFQANQRQQEIRREHAAEVRARLVDLAHKEGFTIEELFGAAASSRRRAKPKFRNPIVPGQTWTGRGKRPRWFSAALLNGLTEDELLIR